MGHGSQHKKFRLKYESWRNATFAFLSERKGEWWTARDLLDNVITQRGNVYKAQNAPSPNSAGQMLKRDGRFATKMGYFYGGADNRYPYEVMFFGLMEEEA